MKKNFQHAAAALVFTGFLFMAFASGDDNDAKASTGDTASAISIGQVLVTDYFDITVNKISIEQSINTGNEFADLPAEEGNVFLVINTTFKNTDAESRMITDGEVLVNYNGKDYTFDKAETVMLEGWGLMLDQINPLTSKTTNLVYKLPAELKGPLYYKPGRSGNNAIIALGNI